MTEEVVRTKRLEVVDDEGLVRITAGVGDNGMALLGITDQNEFPRASLSVDPDGFASLSLNDENGTNLVTISIRPVGTGLQIAEPTSDGSVARITLHVGAENGRASLSISDRREELRATVMVDPDGRPTFLALDEEGNVVDGIGQE